MVGPANLRSRHPAQDPTDEPSEVSRAHWLSTTACGMSESENRLHARSCKRDILGLEIAALNVERAVCVGSGSFIRGASRFTTTESALAAIEEHVYGNGDLMAA